MSRRASVIVALDLYTWNCVTIISTINFSNNEKKFALGTGQIIPSLRIFMHFANHHKTFQWKQARQLDGAPGFYTKGRPLVKSNLICPSDKLSWQPGCPILNINILYKEISVSAKEMALRTINLPEILV